jgi:hypothetical protein
MPNASYELGEKTSLKFSLYYAVPQWNVEKMRKKLHQENFYPTLYEALKRCML